MVGGEEVVPQWGTINREDPAHGQLVELFVHLPGVTDSTAIRFTLSDDRTSAAVSVPGRFAAPSIPLGTAVNPKPLVMRFVRKKEVLKGVFEVAGSSSGKREGPDAAATAAAAAKEEEGDDIDIYAFAKEQANKESAAQCFQEAQGATAAGDWPRAVCLLTKATQLDHGNASYEGALAMAKSAAAGAQANGAAGPSSSGGGSGAVPCGGGSSSNGPGFKQPQKKGKGKGKGGGPKRQPQQQQQQQPKRQEPERQQSGGEGSGPVRETPDEEEPSLMFVVIVASIMLAIGCYVWLWVPLPSSCPLGLSACPRWAGVLWHQLLVAPSFWRACAAYYVLRHILGKLMSSLSMAALVSSDSPDTAPQLNPDKWAQNKSYALSWASVVFILSGRAFLATWMGGGGGFGIFLTLVDLARCVVLSLLIERYRYRPSVGGLDIEEFYVFMEKIFMCARMLFAGISFVGRTLAPVAGTAASGFTLWAAVSFPFRVNPLWQVALWGLVCCAVFYVLVPTTSEAGGGPRETAALVVYMAAWLPAWCYVAGGFLLAVPFWFVSFFTVRYRLRQHWAKIFTGPRFDCFYPLAILLPPWSVILLAKHVVWNANLPLCAAIAAAATLLPPRIWPDDMTAYYALPRSIRMFPLVWGLTGGGKAGLWALGTAVIPMVAMAAAGLFKFKNERTQEFIAHLGVLAVLWIPTSVVCWHVVALVPWAWVRWAIAAAAVPSAVSLMGWIRPLTPLAPVMGVLDWICDVKAPFKWGGTPYEWSTARKQFRGAHAAAGAAASATYDDNAIPPMMPALPVPRGAPTLVRNILVATDHYSVLGVSQGASVDALRRAKRTLSLATHPDKAVGVPGAKEACARVLEASDVLLDSAKRTEYDNQVSAARFEASGAADALFERAADEIFERTGVDISDKDSALFGCTSCAAGMHQCPPVPDRRQESARWCKECRKYHPVAEGEFWMEGSTGFSGFALGTVLRMLACHNGKIYDATALGECEGLMHSWAAHRMPVNSHVNYLAGGGGRGGGSGGGGGGGGARRSRKKGRR